MGATSPTYMSNAQHFSKHVLAPAIHPCSSASSAPSVSSSSMPVNSRLTDTRGIHREYHLRRRRPASMRTAAGNPSTCWTRHRTCSILLSFLSMPDIVSFPDSARLTSNKHTIRDTKHKRDITPTARLPQCAFLTRLTILRVEHFCRWVRG